MRSTSRISVLAMAAACGWAVPAHAQEGDAAAIQQELAAMRAQMAEMAVRMDALQSQLTEAQAKAAAAEAAAGNAVTVAEAAQAAEPATEISWKGAPEISGEGGWSFKPRGRLQYDAGFVDAPDATFDSIAENMKLVRRLG